MTSPRIVPVPSGEDLLPALSAIEPGCWIQASGHVEGVELKLPGEATDVTRLLRGRLALLSLQGPSGGPLSITLARHTDAGIELLGGVLVRARSQGVALFIQPTVAQSPRDPAVRREVVAVVPPSAPAPVTQAAPAPSGAPAPEPPPTRTWAEVAAASEAAEEEEGDSLPERGDLVDHFAFGLCDVIKADGDRLQIRDVKGSGRILEVVLSALKVMPPRKQGNKRCFRLQRRG